MEAQPRPTIAFLHRADMLASIGNEGDFVEIGVANGLCTAEIWRCYRPRTLHLIDPWCNQPGTRWQEEDPAAQEPHEEFYQNILATYGALPGVQIIRDFSHVAVRRFADRSLDAVYIDADHTRTREDMDLWFPKLRSGGWLCGHDYVPQELAPWITTYADVNQWAAEHPDHKLLITEEAYPSWAVKKL